MGKVESVDEGNPSLSPQIEQAGPGEPIVMSGNELREYLLLHPELRPSHFHPSGIVGRLSAVSWRIWVPISLLSLAVLVVADRANGSPSIGGWLALARIPWALLTAIFVLTRSRLLTLFDQAIWWAGDCVQWLLHAPIPAGPRRPLPLPLFGTLIAIGLLSLVSGFLVGSTLPGRLLACGGAMLLLALVWPRLGTTLLAARIPILIAVVYLLILQQDQSLETVRSTNEQSAPLQIGAYVVWGYACALLGLLLALATRDAIDQKLPEKERNGGAWLAGTLFAAPLVFAAFGCWQAGASGWIAWSFIAAYLFVGIVMLVLGIRLARPRGGAGRSTSPRLVEQALTSGILILAALLIPSAVASLGYSAEPPPAALVAGWLVAVAFVIILISRFGQLIRFPLMTLLLGWALLLSWFDLNDNHEIPYRVEPKLAPAPLAEEAFRRWLASPQRQDRPVAFVVVAEGGGARAGYMTALVIEALRGQCSAFRRHHFASIGVSGGSVGAALSAGAPTLPAIGPDCASVTQFGPMRSPAVRSMGSDLLGPTLRGMLFVDLPMRFFPGSLWRTGGDAPPNQLQRPTGDRTSYLERRLGLTWAEQGRLTLQDRMNFGGFLQSPQPREWLQDASFHTAWGGVNGDRPALILLATDVTSGRRIGISHLRFWPARKPGSTTCLSPASVAAAPLGIRNKLLTLADIAPGRDPTLIAGALVSARFPLITPAATLPCPQGEWRAVDGGYFENSGLTTALELTDAMQKGAAAQSAFQIVLIRIEGSEAVTRPQQTPAAGTPSPETSFPEIMSPLRAYGGTREARADQARQAVDELADRRIGSGCATNSAPCSQVLQARFQLKPCHVAIPLGWSLSDAAQADIRQQLGLEGSRDKCVDGAARQNLHEFARIIALATGKVPPPEATR